MLLPVIPDTKHLVIAFFPSYLAVGKARTKLRQMEVTVSLLAKDSMMNCFSFILNMTETSDTKFMSESILCSAAAFVLLLLLLLQQSSLNSNKNAALLVM